MSKAQMLNRVVLGIVAIVAASSASADQSGFYADLDVGQAKYPYSNVIELQHATLRAVDLSIKDTSWDGIVGYRFTPHFGSEVGYVLLGKGSAPVSNASGTGATQGMARFSSKGPTLALVGAVQFGNLEAFLRLGYLSAQVHVWVAATNGSTKLNAKIAANTTAPFGGIGFRYAFNERWHIKAELDRYTDVGDAGTTGSVNINAATLGVGYRF
jgi:opacity protein-like surface antigen